MTKIQPPGKALLIFLDGVGIGPPDPEINPFLTARLPTLLGLLGGQVPILGEPSRASPQKNVASTALDARLGSEGLPQSGTGQAALLTGENCARLFGRHFGPWIPVPLRPLVMENSVLARAKAQGFSAAFANAYPRRYAQRAWKERPAGPPLAAHGAGLLTRHEDALARGDAISSEMLNTAWRTRLGLSHLPEITPAEAGRSLARISDSADLTFFAHYSTDTAGHRRSMASAVAALERVDAFLGGLIPALPPSTLLILASDHGNIEEVTKGHTRNPVFCLLAGPGAHDLSEAMTSITDVPDIILRHLSGGYEYRS